jgi:hypothetical protein
VAVSMPHPILDGRPFRRLLALCHSGENVRSVVLMDPDPPQVRIGEELIGSTT